MRLLIAEDEPRLLRALTAIFEKSKYSVDAVSNGDDALNYGLSGNYDGIILDIMMPGLDGLEVLNTLRKQKVNTPVLLLTAKGEVADRVAGLDCGADDYLTKPFAVSELLARVRAMLRRREDFSPDILTFGNIQLNLGTYELCRGEVSQRLPTREFQLIEMLMRNPHGVVTTANMMERIWGWDSDVEVSIVWVYISNLRKKLSALGADIEIRAVRGTGYSLDLAQ
jgi:Response regulators consisting of a CheY-like receiver domain and a winged-helix DNA-binding domain